jgi:hypothetical protein
MTCPVKKEPSVCEMTGALDMDAVWAAEVTT